MPIKIFRVWERPLKAVIFLKEDDESVVHLMQMQKGIFRLRYGPRHTGMQIIM